MKYRPQNTVSPPVSPTSTFRNGSDSKKQPSDFKEKAIACRIYESVVKEKASDSCKLESAGKERSSDVREIETAVKENSTDDKEIG